MRIIARDNAVNARTATALLYVTVLRNLQPPFFLPGSQSLSYTITEDRAINVAFPERLQGDDNDRFTPNNEVNFRFRTTSVGQNFFGVNAVTGEVFVTNDLRTDVTNTAQYNVSKSILLKETITQVLVLC